MPIIKDGRTVVFETDEFSQIIAKYLDAKLQLNLFPKTWQGIDRLVWRNIEDQIEGPCFRLNDIYFEEFVSAGRTTRPTAATRSASSAAAAWNNGAPSKPP